MTDAPPTAPLLIAIRNAARISVMQRRAGADEALSYRCVSIWRDGRGFEDLDGLRADAPETVEAAVDTLVGLEATMPAPELGDASGYLPPWGGANDPFTDTLTLCFHAEYYRYAIAAELRIRKALAALGTWPLALKPLNAALEAALEIDRPELTATALKPHRTELMKRGRSKGGDSFTGNASYFFRLIADADERLGRPAKAVAALEISQKLGPNRGKLARIILLHDKLGNRSKIDKFLGDYEASYGLTPELARLKSP